MLEILGELVSEETIKKVFERIILFERAPEMERDPFPFDGLDRADIDHGRPCPFYQL
jgi:hypothetical protein